MKSCIISTARWVRVATQTHSKASQTKAKSESVAEYRGVLWLRSNVSAPFAGGPSVLRWCIIFPFVLIFFILVRILTESSGI